MKASVLIITSVFLISFSAFGQSGKDVPANITAAFSQKFPSASKVKWGKESEKEWEAEFIMNGKEYSANYDNAGTLTETEYAITAKEIPAAVKTSLDKESAGYKIEESAVSETKAGKIYEFVIAKGETKMELTIDPAGKVLKKGQMKEEDEEDED
jgi:hypothetical protein